MALSFLRLCSKKRTSFKTLFFENQSDGVSSPPNNVIRRLLTILGTVGISESNLGLLIYKYNRYVYILLLMMLLLLLGFLGTLSVWEHLRSFHIILRIIMLLVIFMIRRLFLFLLSLSSNSPLPPSSPLPPPDFSHSKQRELEQNYQKGLMESVTEFLKNPKVLSFFFLPPSFLIPSFTIPLFFSYFLPFSPLLLLFNYINIIGGNQTRIFDPFI